MILSIRVKPNSKTDQIGYDAYGNLNVKIRAQPVDGQANKYLETYLAGIFKVSKSQVIILKGSNSQYKKVEIVGPEENITKIVHSLKQAK